MVLWKYLLLTLGTTLFDDEAFCYANLPATTSSPSDDELTVMEREDALLANLYKGYNSAVRPSVTVRVKLHFVLMTINKLDTKTQTLSTTGLLSMSWSDTRLSWNSTEYGIEELFVTEATTWTPLLIVANEVKSMSVVKSPDIPMSLMSSGNLIWTPPRIIDTSCSMDTFYYPFDTQVCTISITSLAYGTRNLLLHAGSVDISSFVQSGEWLLQETKHEDYVTHTRRRDLSGIKVTLVMSRRPVYHILHSVFPSILMSFLAPLVFVLPPASGERISYVITVFLSVVVMLTLILGQLPSSSRHTSIFSIYLSIFTLFAALAVPLTVVNVSLYHRDVNMSTSSSARTVGRFLRRILRIKKNKIIPTENAENNTAQTEADTLTYQELADLLDIFYFRMSMAAIGGVAALFTLLITSL